MIRKLFSIVVSHCYYALRQRGKARGNGLANQLGGLTGDMREDCKPAFALHERHDRLFVTGADHGVAFPVTNLTARFNRGRTFGNGAPTNDLPATTLSAGVALAPFSLATKVFPKRSALRLIGVNVLVDRFMAYWQRSCNLLRTPLQIQPLSDQGSRPMIDLKSIPTLLGSLLTKNFSLPGSITSQSRVAQNLPTDCRLVTTQYLGNRLEVLSCFHKCINLITFSLAEMFVAHKVTLTWWSGKPRC